MILINSWWVDNVKEGLYRLSLTIDGVLYGLIEGVYKLILLLANARIFSDTTLKDFIERVYMIIGVVMLFILAYSLLKSLVNPDELTKGKESPAKMLMNLVISMILIAVVPMIFDFAYELQNALLSNNTIGKIVIGTGSAPETAIHNGGHMVSISVFRAFFHPSEGYCQDINEENDSASGKNICEPVLFTTGASGAASISYGNILKQAEAGASFAIFKPMASMIGDDVDDKITYNVLVSSIAAIVVVIMFIKYCFDLAVRAVKLAFFQIIAPVPILARLIPNESAKSIFGKWVKLSLTTFMEVFIRIAILFFVILMIGELTDAFTNGSAFANMFPGNEGLITGTTKFFALAFIVIGLIMFAFQAPKLISDLFGIDSSKMSLGLKSGLTGALFGGVTGFIGGGIAAKKYGGNFKDGALAGAVGGYKGKGNQWKAQANKQYQSLTGDYKGEVGYTGRKTISTLLNEQAGKANKRSSAAAKSARTSRNSDMEELQRELQAYEEGASVLNARINNFENSADYKMIFEQVKSDPETLAAIKNKFNAWSDQNPNASSAEKERAYKILSDQINKERTASILKSINPNYRKEHSDVAHYLRDLDTQEKLILASTRGNRDENLAELKDMVSSKIHHLEKQIKKDTEISNALHEKSEKDEFTKALTEAIKNSKIDLNGKDSKK